MTSCETMNLSKWIVVPKNPGSVTAPPLPYPPATASLCGICDYRGRAIDDVMGTKLV